jgi:hypothetical protein
MTISTKLTSGAGFNYEDGVAAFYLVSILTEGDPLGLPETTATSVRLQRASTGHPLDDLIVEGRQGSGAMAHLDLQVTTSLRLSASDDKLADIVARAWRTVTSADFQVGRDRVGGVVRSVSEAPIQDLQFLCEAARFSVDDADFASRAESFSQGKRRMLGTFRKLLGREVGREASVAEVCHLLRHFVLLRLDVIGDDAAEAHAAVERLRGRLVHDDTNRARELWGRLLVVAQRAKVTGGSVDRPLLDRELGAGFELTPQRSLRVDMDRLAAETRFALGSIRDAISGVRPPRAAIREQVETAADEARLVHLVGRPGVGKSVALKMVGEVLAEQGRALVLKADRLMEGGWAGFRARHQLRAETPTDLLRAMSLAGPLMILTDGIDRVQPAHRPVVTDILTALLEASLSGNGP